MKKLLLLTLVALALGGSLFAQNAAPIQGGNISASSTNCTVSFSCVWESVLPQNAGTTTVNLAGTFSATLLVEESNNGGQTWSTAATLSAAGTTTYSTNGFTDIRVRCSAFTSGSAAVTISTGLLQVQSVVSGGSSSSASSTGPVINVTAFGAAPTLADNNTAFTAAMVAANALNLVGTPTVKQIGFNHCTSCTALNVTIPIAQNDTVLVFILGTVASRTFTISDGGSPYGLYQPLVVGGSSVLLMATAPGGATQAAASLSITDSGAAENIAAEVVTYSNVGSYRQTKLSATGTSTTPAFTQTTLDTNNSLVSVCGWFDGTIKSASANTGILQHTFPSSATEGGTALITQTSAALAALTDNVTLSGSSVWGCTGIELRSRSNINATFYVPANGTYIYSGGLVMTQPMTLKCEPGTVLDYTGTGKAVDMGPTGLTTQIQQGGFYVDGCTFIDGKNMTDGLFLEPETTVHGVRNTTFQNFGNSTGYMVTGTCDNWDVEFGPQVRIKVSDGVPRNILRMNVNNCNDNSFVRVHDVEAYCLAGDFAATLGCSAAQTGVGFWLDSAVSLVTDSNIAFFNPDIKLGCRSGPCFGIRVENNMLETVGSGSGVCPIQFVGAQDKVAISHNTFNMHATAESPVCPVDGVATMSGTRANFNTVSNQALATPFVRLNNLVGQTGNQSNDNSCSVATGGGLPCALIHTAGGNINNWNADKSGTCTMTAGACTVFNFSQTYAAAPKCSGSWTGGGVFTGILKVLTSTTQLTITDTVGTDTAVVNWTCGADPN